MLRNVKRRHHRYVGFRRFYLEDIEGLYGLLSQRCQSVNLAIGLFRRREADSPADLPSAGGFRYLRMRGIDPDVTIALTPNYAEVEQPWPDQKGAALVDEVVRSLPPRSLAAFFRLMWWFLTIFAVGVALILVPFVILLLRHDSVPVIVYIGIASLVLLAIVIPARLMRGGAMVTADRRGEAHQLSRETRRAVIIGISMSLFGAVVGALLTLAVK